MSTRSRSSLGLAGGLVAGTVCAALISETLYHHPTHGPQPRKEHLEVSVSSATTSLSSIVTIVSTR